ncbi:amastin-like protein [Novymonas esmeraldas]|uniref:Amastin-like protein n=1 Tax=Novymonas esmeraldas TaxID=1808958 RepID=A0AAW0EWK9_9TRYP
MACRIGIIIYAILQFVAFVLVLVGTPIDMFREKEVDALGNTACLTLWGAKLKCYSTKYDAKTNDLWANCKPRLTRFRAAEAFALISIVLYGVACLFGFIMLCCCSCFRWICLVFNIVGICTSCVTWACMVEAYYRDQGPGITCAKFEGSLKYGAGFALFVAGWCVNIINIVFLMLPC